jgi:hypothetical protein
VASSRGRGIFIVSHPNQVPLDEPMVIITGIKHVSRPWLKIVQVSRLWYGREFSLKKKWIYGLCSCQSTNELAVSAKKFFLNNYWT